MTTGWPLNRTTRADQSLPTPRVLGPPTSAIELCLMKVRTPTRVPPEVARVLSGSLVSSAGLLEKAIWGIFLKALLRSGPFLRCSWMQKASSSLQARKAHTEDPWATLSDKNVTFAQKIRKPLRFFRGGLINSGGLNRPLPRRCLRPSVQLRPTG